MWLCTGWRFGAVFGKSGVFPSDYVRPVAAPDFLILPAERVEPRDRHGRVAASAAVAVAMGSAVAAHELDISTEVRTGYLAASVFITYVGMSINSRFRCQITSSLKLWSQCLQSI